MSTLAPSFLIQNAVQISNYRQHLPQLPGTYREFSHHPLVAKVLNQAPSYTLQRNDVENIFVKEGFAAGAVAAVMWGWINTRFGHFQRMLKLPESDLAHRVSATSALVTAGKLDCAFMSMQQGGPNQIPGLGPAYFTKILFFLGQCSPALQIKPLIFDKWTKLAYAALLSEYDPAKARKFFIFKSDGVRLRESQILACYLSYVTDMDHWASALAPLSLDSARIEEYIFGRNLKLDPSAANPRHIFLYRVKQFASK